MVDRVLTQAMSEYAEAIRGDWSEFDGRSEKAVILSWIQELQSPDMKHDISWWRDELGLCLAGKGHWCGPYQGHCSAGIEYWDCNCECTKED